MAKIKVYSLVSDTDNGIDTEVYATEAELNAELTDTANEVLERDSKSIDDFPNLDVAWDYIWEHELCGDATYHWNEHTLELANA